MLVPAAWLCWAAWNVFQGLEAARAAEARIRVLSESTPSALVGPATEATLAAAQADVAEAERRLGNPFVSPLTKAPIIGRNLETGRAMAASAKRLVDAAVPAWRELRALSVAGTDVRGVSTAVTDVRRILTPVLAAVRAADLGPSADLLAQVTEARDQFERKLEELGTVLGNADRVLAAFEKMSNRSGRYLVVAGNNAEMGSGMGLFLFRGDLIADDGRFSVGAFDRSDAALKSSVVLPEDLSARWDSLVTGKELSTVSMSARFDQVAEASADIVTAQGFGPYDGVVYVDPLFLKEALRLTGPVEAFGERVTADSVVQLLLSDQYAAPDFQERGQRSRALALLTQTAAQRLLNERMDPVELFEVLRRSADGRHLMLWSRDPVEQAGWEAAGAAGMLGPRSLAVNLLNRGANKLDWWVDVDATMTTRELSNGTAIQLSVTVTNRSTANLPRYVLNDRFKGDYLGVLSFQAPARSTLSAEGHDGLLVQGPDGPTEATAVLLWIRQGQSRTVTATMFVTRNGPIRIEPSARARPIRWTVDGRSFDDARARTVPMPAGAAPVAG
ncbi:MAG: DUF4012 domain-containing protein [Acidimicrobiales bacterium]